MVKKSLKFLFLLILMVSFVHPVNALVYEGGSTGLSCYHFDKTTGAYSSSGGRDCLKKFDGDYVYCVQWSLPFGDGSNYQLDSTWKSNTKSAIIAGIIMDLVDAEYDGVKGYAMTAAVLNTYFSKSLNSSSSMNFYSTNTAIKEIYDQAFAEYKNVKLSKKLPEVSLTASDSVLHYLSGSSYLSGKITLSGLSKTYGGDSDTVKYVIKPTVSTGTAKICTNSTGTKCSDSITLTDKESYSFYVRVEGATSEDTVSIKVTGSNSSTYPTSIRYVYASDKQKVLKRDEITISRSTSKTIHLTVPDLTKHRIIGYKVDENGELLKGATLEIYKDDATVAGNLLAKNDGEKGTVSYTSPTVSTEDDDFFKHNYYLVEKSAPDGYVLSSKIKDIYLYDSSVSVSSSSKKCYYNGDDDEAVEVTDSERCNFSAYEYKCLSSDGIIKDLSENENCDFTVSSEDTGSGETTNESTTGTDTGSGTTEGGESTGTGSDAVTGGDEVGGEDGDTSTTEPEITYEKVCFNVDKQQVVSDITYCSDKGKYTLVTKSSGNLVFTQSNVKNSVKISKRAMTGEDEVVGAALKICTAADYESKKDDCDPAKTVADVEMSWISGSTPNEFVGLKKGSYYVIEVTPPSGYIKTTIATEFSIDEYGVVKSGDSEVADNLVVIKNQINSLTISKQDIATSEELPGATISICLTYKDDSGNVKMLTDQYENECIPARLHDGTEATWVSTEKPKVLSGLPAGTYYLVERIAPKGYSTAESILFTLNEDGTLADKDGNSLADNKLVMHDKELEEVKTGMLPFYIVGGILIVVVGLGIGSYYYMNKNTGKVLLKNRKIRKRKIHQKSL